VYALATEQPFQRFADVSRLKRLDSCACQNTGLKSTVFNEHVKAADIRNSAMSSRARGPGLSFADVARPILAICFAPVIERALRP
jgi:hypothetical protein